MLWSGVGFLAEVPSGALADRFGRRRALVASSLFQAAGYVLWITLPGFASFAAGFVLWGFGGALASGAFEALLYEALVERNAADHYVRVNSSVYTIGLLSQIPSSGLAALLLWMGGYDLVGWVSIAVCVASSLLATRLPEPRRLTTHPEEEAGYLATLRLGLSEAFAEPAVRGAVLAVAVIAGLDGLEEYFPLMGKLWGIPTAIIPLAIVLLPLSGAAGAALGGRAGRLSARKLAATLFGALSVLGAAAIVALPAGLAGVALFYALHQMILVVAGARLQDRIKGPARATVNSAASLGTEVVGIVLFIAWAMNGLLLVAGIWLALSLLVPRWLGDPASLPARR